MVDKMGSNNVKITMCADFQYGKQDRNPKSGTGQGKNKGVGGSLNINQLEPGKLIFSEHYESSTPGIVFWNRG